MSNENTETPNSDELSGAAPDEQLVIFLRHASWIILIFPFMFIFICWMHFWEWFHFRCSSKQIQVNRDRYDAWRKFMRKWMGR